jgi:fatty acid desaturase
VNAAINIVRLLVFPAVEVSAIMLAWISWSRSLVRFAACILLGAVALSYSLHIVFHEVVHRRYFRRQPFRVISELLISLLLGTPFSEYYQSHWRHHRYTNLIQDSTSTWRMTSSGVHPRGFWSYSLGWMGISSRAIKALVREKRTGELSNDIVRKIYCQGALLLVLHCSLLLLAPALWLAYVLTIYFGYVGIAAINYLQHPPRVYGSGYTTSFHSHFYNAVFYNNGLHFEHHERMQAPIAHLKPTNDSGQIYRVGHGLS